MVPMQAGPTGSGVRYVAFDDSGLVWHTKGREGFLARDAGADQTTLNGNCVEAP
jgi:membrane-bound inhibitor of C-type lysozyme